MDPSRLASHWDPEDERHPDTATPVVFADSLDSAFAAPDAKVFRAELDPRYASVCRPSTVFWGNNKYSPAQIKKMIGHALRGLPPHPQAYKSPVHHSYPILRQALDRPMRMILHGEADPNMAVGSAVLWFHIVNILEGKTSASGEGRYSSDVMIQFAITMVTSGTRCHFIAGDDYLQGTRDYDVQTPSADYHRVRALRLGAFALTVNDANHWTAVLHHIASGTTYIFEPGPRAPQTRWRAHVELRVNFNKLLLKWGLPPTSSYMVAGGEPQLGSWQCGYVLILQLMSFLHSDGLLQWDKSSLYRGLQTAQAREAYGMRKIADWALHLWTGEQDVCCPSPEVSELLSLSERRIQARRMASLKTRLSAGSGISKRPTVRRRDTAPPDLAISPSTWRWAMGRPLYPQFSPAGWERPVGLEFDAAAAREEVLAHYADPSFKKTESWKAKGSRIKSEEFRLGGELGRAYDYLAAMVCQNPGRAAKIGLSPVSVRDRGAWLKLVTALIIKRGDPMRALEYIGRCYPRAP